MAKMSCTRLSSNKFGSALAGIIIAFRKNIGGEFSVIRRLLGSKRALYLVNTSEEFFLSNCCEGMIVVRGAVLNIQRILETKENFEEKDKIKRDLFGR